MSSNDSFKEIDEKLVDLDRSEYKEQLEARGVRVEFDHGETHLSFKMYYADGGYHGFRLTRGERQYKLQWLFTDEKRNRTRLRAVVSGQWSRVGLGPPTARLRRPAGFAVHRLGATDVTRHSHGSFLFIEA